MYQNLLETAGNKKMMTHISDPKDFIQLEMLNKKTNDHSARKDECHRIVASKYHDLLLIYAFSLSAPDAFSSNFPKS